MYLRSVTVGFVSTNCYLLGDEGSKKAAVIDPGDHGKKIYELLKQDGIYASLYNTQNASALGTI